MLNQKYYPFERNRYYYGKLLTAKDFENEQKYVNDKRRLLNKMISGTGVVCGLNTYAADEYSIIVDTGLAIDAQGREIVIDEPVIRRVNTIENFEKIKGETAYLALEYHEEAEDLVYSPMSEENKEEERQYNKIKEKYKLTLENPENVVVPQVRMKDFIQEHIIYEDEEIKVTQLTPRFANEQSALRIKAILEKKAGNIKEYNLEYSLELQGFTDELEQSRLRIAFEMCQLDVGEKFVKEYTLIPKSNLQGNIEFFADLQNLKVELTRKNSSYLRKNIKIDLEIRKDQVWDWLQEIYYKNSMDTYIAQTGGEKIWLAEIKMIRSNSNCMIDQIKAMPFKQFVVNPMQLMMGERLKEYYPEQSGIDITGLVAAASDEPRIKEVNHNMEIGNYLATGYVDIPVGLNANTREPIFSDEIMHGLGEGSVYIELGVEYVTESKNSKENSGEIILGEASLFEERQTHPIKLEHAVKIFKDKGTFMIAIRLQEGIAATTVRIRWFAFKLPETQLRVKKEQVGMLMVTPDTKVIKPHDTVTFKPVFMHMDAQPCSYSVLESEGGSINNMGVYTAPAKEGVYTVQVQSISKPEMVATAFVVVRQERE